MIELSRQQIHRIRSTFRQALGRSSPRKAMLVTVDGTPQELRVRAVSDRLAIEHRVPGSFPPVSFAIPFEALAACEGRRETPVRFTLADGQVTLHWTDANIPQAASFLVVEPVALPEAPSELTPIERTFLAAMVEACATTDAESKRYALSCVRLRGADGQIAATDGQQALVQTGFTFPWSDDVLVPATGAFVAKAIRAAARVSLGRSTDWVFIRADEWTVALQIEKERRFPAIEAHIPAVSSASTTMVLAETDAVFLDQAAQRLPGAGEMNSPVTLDLNGAVVVRTKSGEQSSVTDLVLRNSRRQGEELKVSSNREYVCRAIQMGFREIHFRDADAPAFCRDDRRNYFWAVLGKDAVLKPDTNATRIESPSVGRTARVAMTKPVSSPSQQTPLPSPIRNHISMTTATTNRIHGPITEAAGANGKTLSALIEEGEQLRATLCDVLSRTKTLVVGLKRQRQQSNAMRTALKSLRAMQAIEV